MQIVQERRGSRRKRWRIRVSPIARERYSEFRNDPGHAFASMAPEKRLAELDEYCAKLWVAKAFVVDAQPAAGEVDLAA